MPSERAIFISASVTGRNGSGVADSTARPVTTWKPRSRRPLAQLPD